MRLPGSKLKVNTKNWFIWESSYTQLYAGDNCIKRWPNLSSNDPTSLECGISPYSCRKLYFCEGCTGALDRAKDGSATPCDTITLQPSWQGWSTWFSLYTKSAEYRVEHYKYAQKPSSIVRLGCGAVDMCSVSIEKQGAEGCWFETQPNHIKWHNWSFVLGGTFFFCRISIVY